MADLEHVLQFLDDLFDAANFPDYPNAMNGLQVQGRKEIEHVVAAVDASEAGIVEAARRGGHLLLVHHGLFWDGLRPLTGPRFRKVAALVRGDLNLFSLHLPLDAHPVFGNNAVLLDRLGLSPSGRFGSFQDVEVGWWASGSMKRDKLLEGLEEAVEGKGRLIPGGPEEAKRIGVVTGAGAGLLPEAASAGLDTLVTGEAPHHAYHEALELGVNLLLGGHYATETFGVKALGERVAREFSLSWEFLDLPTGL